MEFDFGDGLCLGVAVMFPFVLLWRSAWEHVDHELQIAQQAGDGAEEET